LQQPSPAPIVVARFEGTVHDSEAWPVAGATVRVVAAGGLKAFALGETTTDQAGAFRLEFDESQWRPSAVRLQVVEGVHVLLETAELALPRPADAAPLALVLPPEAGIATSRYELLVAVADETGASLPEVPVYVLAGAERPQRPGQGGVEAEGRTAADGTATLTGRTLGGKWLFVDGRPLGRCSHLAPLALDRAGAHRVTVALPAGGTLEATISTLTGKQLEWANVWLEEDATGLTFPGQLRGDGSVAFSGLGSGTHALMVTADWNLSPARRAGLRAGEAGVHLRLKPRDEEQDVGDHMAELHGQLVDAETGEVVRWSGFAVDVLPARAGESTLPMDRITPRGPAQQMESGQTYDRFHEVGLAAGASALIAAVPGYAMSVAEVDLREGEVRAGLRVPLHRGGELRGVVRDGQGRPVRGAHVFVVGVGELADQCVAEWRVRDDSDDYRSAHPSFLASSALTDEEGAFVLRAVPPGVAMRVVARHREAGFGVLPGSVVRSGEKVTGIEVRLSAR
jgi:hypothetical protein